jgi:hypothetical protein
LYLQYYGTVVGVTVSVYRVDPNVYVISAEVITGKVDSGTGSGRIEARLGSLILRVDGVLLDQVTEAVKSVGVDEVRGPDSGHTATVAVGHQRYRHRLDTDRRWRLVGRYAELQNVNVEVATAVASTYAQGVITWRNTRQADRVRIVSVVHYFAARQEARALKLSGRAFVDSVQLYADGYVRAVVHRREGQRYFGYTLVADAREALRRLVYFNYGLHFVVDLHELYVAEEATAVVLGVLKLVDVVIAVVVIVAVQVVAVVQLDVVLREAGIIGRTGRTVFVEQAQPRIVVAQVIERIFTGTYVQVQLILLNITASVLLIPGDQVSLADAVVLTPVDDVVGNLQLEALIRSSGLRREGVNLVLIVIRSQARSSKSTPSYTGSSIQSASASVGKISV